MCENENTKPGCSNGGIPRGVSSVLCSCLRGQGRAAPAAQGPGKQEGALWETGAEGGAAGRGSSSDRTQSWEGVPQGHQQEVALGSKQPESEHRRARGPQ